MKRISVLFAALTCSALAVVGCGDKEEEIPPSDFTEEDYAEWLCDWQFNTCPDYKVTTTETVDDCVVEATTEMANIYDECVWRGDKAEACVASVEEGECSVSTLTGECLEIWDCSSLWTTEDEG